MPQVSMKLVYDDQTIDDSYNRLKRLLKSEQYENAEKFFLDNSLLKDWRPLMHYAMTRRNCSVTCCLIDYVYKHAKISKTAFRIEISKLLHDIAFTFSTQVTEYINSGQYEVEVERIAVIGNVVKAGLTSRTQKGIVNLKDHHFLRQYGE